MLSETAVRYLSTRVYRQDAKREINILPLGGIYWDDEYPVVEDTEPVPPDDHRQILRMFMLRVDLWKGEELTPDQQRFWNGVYAQVPTWALFQRLEITEDDMKAQEFGTHLADEFEAAITQDADEVVRDQDGRVHAIFDLNKDEPDEPQDVPSSKPRIQ